MASFLHTGKYGAINVAYPITVRCYVLKYVYDAFYITVIHNNVQAGKYGT